MNWRELYEQIGEKIKVEELDQPALFFDEHEGDFVEIRELVPHGADCKLAYLRTIDD